MKKKSLLLLIALALLPFLSFSQTARVQVIHNSADAAAATVDVYLNGNLLLDDFAFRTASPFIDAPAGVPIEIDIAPSTSTSVSESIYNMQATLAAGEKYLLVASGIVSASGYDPATSFAISVFDMAREKAATAGNTDVLVYHGATDAPTVDIYEQDAGELVNNLAYGNFAGYLELPTADYHLQVRDETGNSVVASYDAPLASLNLTDSALTVIASGFLTPANNSDGPAFGLWVALPSGGDLIELPVHVNTSAIQSSVESDRFLLYPNPAGAYLNISYKVDQDRSVKFSIYDLTGTKVEEIIPAQSNISAGNYDLRYNTERLKNGIYFVVYETGENTITRKINIIR